MDLLREIDRSLWPELRDLYRRDWPQKAVPFCLLETHISYPNLAEAFTFKVFSLHGDVSKGMIAISDQHGYFELLIYLLGKDINLDNIIASTKIINWDNIVSVASIYPETEECFERLKDRLNLHITKVSDVKYLLNRDSTPFALRHPPDTYVGPLRAEHIEFVDNTWKFQNPSTYKLFETLIKNKLTCALYSTRDDALLAWITRGPAGCLTHLYCVEEYRRRGYAEFITKFAVNDLLGKGKDVLAYTVDDNVKAQKLFDKLNFVRLGYERWLDVNKL